MGARRNGCLRNQPIPGVLRFGVFIQALAYPPPRRSFSVVRDLLFQPFPNLPFFLLFFFSFSGLLIFWGDFLSFLGGVGMHYSLIGAFFPI